MFLCFVQQNLWMLFLSQKYETKLLQYVLMPTVYINYLVLWTVQSQAVNSVVLELPMTVLRLIYALRRIRTVPFVRIPLRSFCAYFSTCSESFRMRTQMQEMQQYHWKSWEQYRVYGPNCQKNQWSRQTFKGPFILDPKDGGGQSLPFVFCPSYCTSQQSLWWRTKRSKCKKKNQQRHLKTTEVSKRYFRLSVPNGRKWSINAPLHSQCHIRKVFENSLNVLL